MLTATEQRTLWSLGQGTNVVECVASSHPLGMELRYVMNGRLLMSRVFDSWERLANQSQVWREGLQLRGWLEEYPFGRVYRSA